MFNHEVKFITDISLNEARSFGSFVTFEELKSSNLHPAILKYISAEIDLLIFEDRQRLLESSKFDYTGEEINSHFEQINQIIKRSKKFSADQIDKLVYNAITFNFNYLIHPKKALLKFIYKDEWVRSTQEVIQLLNYSYYYDFIKKFCEKYFYKKAFLTIDKQEFESTIEKLDKEIFGSYSKTVTDLVLNSMADFFNIGTVNKNKIPLIAVEQFVVEKRLATYIERFQNAFPKNSKMLYQIDDLRKILYTPLPKDADHTEEELRNTILNLESEIDIDFKTPKINSGEEEKDLPAKKIISKNDFDEENIIDDEDIERSENISQELPKLKSEEKLIDNIEEDKFRKEKEPVENEKEVLITKFEEDVKSIENIDQNEDEQIQESENAENHVEENLESSENEIENTQENIEDQNLQNEDEIPPQLEKKQIQELEWRSDEDDDFIILGEEEAYVDTENIDLNEVDEKNLLREDENFEIEINEDEVEKEKVTKQNSGEKVEEENVELNETNEIIDQNDSPENIIKEKPEEEILNEEISDEKKSYEENVPEEINNEANSSEETIPAEIIDKNEIASEPVNIDQNDVQAEELEINDEGIISGEIILAGENDEEEIELIENQNVEERETIQIELDEIENDSFELEEVEDDSDIEIKEDISEDELMSEFLPVNDDEEEDSEAEDFQPEKEIDEEKIPAKKQEFEKIEIYFEDEDEDKFEDEKISEPENKLDESKPEIEKPRKQIQDDEKDIFSFFSDKELQIVLDGIFASDAEDFALTIDTLAASENYDEALTVLHALFKSYRIRPSSKEAQILTKVVTEFYNQSE